MGHWPNPAQLCFSHPHLPQVKQRCISTANALPQQGVCQGTDRRCCCLHRTLLRGDRASVHTCSSISQRQTALKSLRSCSPLTQAQPSGCGRQVLHGTGDSTCFWARRAHSQPCQLPAAARACSCPQHSPPFGSFQVSQAGPACQEPPHGASQGDPQLCPQQSCKVPTAAISLSPKAGEPPGPDDLGSICMRATVAMKPPVARGLTS